MSRVLHAALTTGCALFLGVALFLRQGVEPGQTLDGEPHGLDVLVYINAGMGLLLGVGLANVLPHLVTQGQLGRLAEAQQSGELTGTEAAERLLGTWRAVRIIGWAVIEGGVLLNVTAYLITGEQLSLTLALALLTLLVLKAPRHVGLEQWLERQEQALGERAAGITRS